MGRTPAETEKRRATRARYAVAAAVAIALALLAGRAFRAGESPPVGDNGGVVATGGPRRAAAVSGQRGPSPAANLDRDPPGKAWVLLESQGDQDCDGIPDRWCNSVTYGPDRRTEVERIDRDCDGTPDERHETAWDADHRREWSKRFGPDGKPGGCRFTEFDDLDKPVAWVADEDCDGKPESERRTLSDDGVVAEVREVKGGVVRCETVTYDEYRRVVARTHYRDCGTEATSCEWSAYEERDGLTTRWNRHDDDCDGRVDREAWIETNEDGDLLGYALYENGRLKSETVPTRIGPGGESEQRMDFNGDGVPEACARMVPDRDRRRTVAWIDDRCDGTFETCRVGERDAHGEITRVYDDEGCDGTPDRGCAIWIYGYR